jgi:hypothetical protein
LEENGFVEKLISNEATFHIIGKVFFEIQFYFQSIRVHNLPNVLVQIANKMGFKKRTGEVNRQNVHIWGTEQPHAQIEHRRDSPEVNVFCAVSREKVHSPFFFPEATVSGDSFLDMLENWLLPQLNINYNDHIPQLDGATLHFHTDVQCFSIVFFHSAGSNCC